MSWKLLQGDVMDKLRELSNKSVQLFNKFIIDVLFTMNPFVTFAAKGDAVVCLKSKIFMCCPALNVVNMQPLFPLFPVPASLASIIVTTKDNFKEILPFAFGIKRLSFWRTASFVIRVGFTSAAKHAIGLTGQPPSFYLSYFRHRPSGNVKFTQKIINVIFSNITFLSNARRRPLLVNVLFIKPFPISVWADACFGQTVLRYRSGRYAKVNKPFVNTFRVTINNLGDGIRGKVFSNILLLEPFFCNRLRLALRFSLASQRTICCWFFAISSKFSFANRTNICIHNVIIPPYCGFVNLKEVIA
jgi:hypothetical protein